MANPGIFGRWTSYKSEQLEELFNAMGYFWLSKKLGASTNVTASIQLEGESAILLSISSVFIKTEILLNIGSITEWDGGTNKMMDCLTCWENGGLVIYMGEPGTDPKESGKKQRRELLENGDLLLTVTWDGVEAKRWFKREQK